MRCHTYSMVPRGSANLSQTESFKNVWSARVCPCKNICRIAEWNWHNRSSMSQIWETGRIQPNRIGVVWVDWPQITSSSSGNGGKYKILWNPMRCGFDAYYSKFTSEVWFIGYPRKNTQWILKSWEHLSNHIHLDLM